MLAKYPTMAQVTITKVLEVNAGSFEMKESPLGGPYSIRLNATPCNALIKQFVLISGT
jgi:hypothetical protein